MNNDLYFKAGAVFTPNTPIKQSNLFSGRESQIKSLLRAVSGLGSHAVIFGERGVGKTSLGHIILGFLPEDGSVLFAAVSCDSGMPYSSIWNAILERLSVSVPKNSSVGFQSAASLEKDNLKLANLVRNPENISSQEVRAILEQLPNTAIILIDEVDRLNEDTTRRLADTIKTFSDYNVNVRLIIIGVGDSVAQLIAGHESIERALVQIHMPRMNTEEIENIASNGLKELGMTIEDEVKEKIVALSRGLPHYMHLLMLHATRYAAESDRTKINQDDFKSALQESVKEKEQSLKNGYDLAVQSTKKAYLFPYVLLACALAEPDKDGYFALTDVQKPLQKMRGEDVGLAAFISHVGAFSTVDRGPILERIGKERKYRYRFKNPLMQTYVIMKAINDGLESKIPIEELL